MVWVFSIERLIVINKASGTGNVGNFVRKVQTLINGGNIDTAIAECDKQKGSVANVIKAGLLKYKDVSANPGLDSEKSALAIQKEIEETTALEMPMLEKNLNVIATLVSIGTLTGLLGTVTGMIKAFSALATGGAPDSAKLANGISEALAIQQQLYPLDGVNVCSRECRQVFPVIVTENTTNELYHWVQSARLATAEITKEKESEKNFVDPGPMKIAIKADANEKYPSINLVIETLRNQKQNKFSFVTGLKELNQDSGKQGKGGKVRSKKNGGKVDLTAMVDLAFLLITFFMLTTSLNKPQAMDVAMPDKNKMDATDNLGIAKSRSMHIILGAVGTASAQSLKDAQAAMEAEQYDKAKGQIYLVNDKVDSAAIIFNNGLTNDPKSQLNNVGLGIVDLKNNNNSAAEQKFTTATSNLDTTGRLHLLLPKRLKGGGKKRNLGGIPEKAVQLIKKETVARNAETAIFASNQDRTLVAAAKIFEIPGSMPESEYYYDANYYIGEINYNLGQKKVSAEQDGKPFFDKADKAFGIVVGATKQEVVDKYLIPALYYRGFAQLDPKNNDYLVDANNYLGVFNYAKGNNPKAKEFFQATLAINPTDEFAKTYMEALSFGMQAFDRDCLSLWTVTFGLYLHYQKEKALDCGLE
ncbi:hypothetical protein FQR65_LT17976 [Abscondita terminalis]|nr:hypothetical protein FQR65_LT17976 [Abscondita terminalis]